MLDWLGNIGLEHWLQGGAVGALAIALFLVLLGWLVPKKTLDTLRETLTARIDELNGQQNTMRSTFVAEKAAMISDQSAREQRMREDHASRMAEQKEMVGIWRDAHAQSERVREIEAGTNDRLVEGFATLDGFIRGMKTAGADERETPR